MNEPSPLQPPDPPSIKAKRRSFAASLWERMGHHELSGRAAQMAFYFLLAVFPILLALVGLLSLLHLESHLGTLDYFVERGMPQGVANLILGEVHRLQTRSGWPLLLSVGLSAYYGGSGVTSALHGVAIAHDVKRRIGLLQLLGLGFAGLVVLALPAVLVLVTAVIWAVSWGARHGLVPMLLAQLVELLGWPLMFLVFQQLVNGVYRIGAASAVRWGWFSLGSTLATVAWMAVTFGFELYLRVVTDLGATYGSLGAVVGLLFYAHIVSMCVLLGAEVDGERAQRRAS